MKYKALLAAGLLAAGFGVWASTLTEPLPAPWALAGKHREHYMPSIDRSTALTASGAKTLQAGPGAEADNSFGTIMQSIRPTRYAGQRVRFSAMVKTRAVEGWTGLWLRADVNGRSAAFDNMQDRALRGSADWQRQEVVLDIPADASMLAFGLLQSGSGQSWMDDLRLEVVDTSVATTARTRIQQLEELPTEPVL